MKILVIVILHPFLCSGQLLQSMSIQLPYDDIQNIEQCQERAKHLSNIYAPLYRKQTTMERRREGQLTRLENLLKHYFREAEVVVMIRRAVMVRAIEKRNQPVDIRLAEIACVHTYYANLGARNVTDLEWELFDSAAESGLGYMPPPSGFRVRHEIRTLSAEEWNEFANVILTMYNEGTLRKFGLLHGSAIKRYHKGAAFLPWHRVFLTHFEEEMRKINPRVSLPYWDYTIDNNITQPVESVVWSDCFLGNGEGTVTSGPFKNFYGGLGAFVSRNYAKTCASKLINKIDIKSLLDYCKFEDITTGSGKYEVKRHNLELLHDGVHDWIGGDMGRVEFSAFDPVFYLHHAFIDYIWETFREHQIKNCGDIDIETDYRSENDLGQNNIKYQKPHDQMWGYFRLMNKYGLSKNWTRQYYNYSSQPSCPDNCKGEYLYCDVTADPRYPQGLCMTKTKDACKRKNVRETSSATDNTDNLVPKLSCSAGMRMKGFPGDGRNRETSEKKSQRILLQEIARGDDEDRIENADSDHGKEITTWSSFGIGFLVGSVLGILLTSIVYFVKIKNRRQNIKYERQ